MPPMRTAIISDIHGNLEAFLEVLRDMEHCRIDRVVSLGDNIGYGPDPEEVLRRLHVESIISIMGNHELGIADPSYLDWFNASARRSLLITRELLSPWSLDFITSMPATHIISDALCVHGFPPDSITTYLFQVSEEEMIRQFHASPCAITFVGHTHELRLVLFDGSRVERRSLRKGLIELNPECKLIVNAGSVGQPRDGDNRAKYLIWDKASLTLEVRYIPYDIATTARKILDRGFPRINADRLW